MAQTITIKNNDAFVVSTNHRRDEKYYQGINKNSKRESSSIWEQRGNNGYCFALDGMLCKKPSNIKKEKKRKRKIKKNYREL